MVVELGGLGDRLGQVEPIGQLEQAAGEVGPGEAPVEGHGGVVVERLEGQEPPLDRRQVGESFGVSTLRCTMEK